MPTDVQPGDLVLVAAGGRVFYARVPGHESFGRLRLAPLDPSVRASSTKLSDITDHWRIRAIRVRLSRIAPRRPSTICSTTERRRYQ